MIAIAYCDNRHISEDPVDNEENNSQLEDVQNDNWGSEDGVMASAAQDWSLPNIQLLDALENQPEHALDIQPKHAPKIGPKGNSQVPVDGDLGMTYL